MSDYDEGHQTQELSQEVEHFAQQVEDSISSFNHTEQQPSAPVNDENGFIVVPPQQQPAASEHVVEDIVVSKPVEKEHEEPKRNEEPVAKKAACDSNTGCNTCPYYFLGISSLNKVHIPPKVRDLVLWTNPKYTGAVFGSTLVLLLSLATFTLLSVVSTLLLLALTTVGAYRFYLSLLFRIKGTYDDTFERISSFDLSLPKDKIQELARLLDSDVNKTVNQLKSIVLWDNLATSSIAFFATYMVYCVGSLFNTITLLILALVAVFSLPKVYQIYQVQIDQTIQQATAFAHKTADDIMAKLPFLKKKVQ